MTNRSFAQRLAILALAILQVLTPLLPEVGIGSRIGEQSDAVQTIITPAGWAFSIWGALYTGSLAYAVWQALPAQRTNGLLDRIGWYTAGAFLGNAAWAAYVQVYELTFVSVAIILFTLTCLLQVYRRFSLQPGRFTAGEQWLAVLPLSALTAWLTAASIVNIAASLQFHGAQGGADTPLIGAAVLVVGGFIAAAALWNGRGNPWYAAVFLWALAAIFAAGGQESRVIAIAVAVAAGLVAGSALSRLSIPENRRRWLRGG